MKVILFGATGMIGQGVLREALLDPTVERVLTVGRSATGQQHAKLEELLVPDLADLTPVAAKLTGYDACLFCLGITSSGMTEDAYRQVTVTLPVAAARVLLATNPGIAFLYISGAGTDSTAKGRSMWARVKGEAENALLAMPFKRVHMFRPGIIQPVHGARSRTRSYRILYKVLWPLLPLMRATMPGMVTTSERVAKAMLLVARSGTDKPILTTRDINQLARQAPV